MGTGVLIHLFSPLHILLLSMSQHFPPSRPCFPAEGSAALGVSRSPNLSPLAWQSPPWGSIGCWHLPEPPLLGFPLPLGHLGCREYSFWKRRQGRNGKRLYRYCSLTGDET